MAMSTDEAEECLHFTELEILFSLLFLGSFKKEIKAFFEFFFFLKIMSVAVLHEGLHILFWLSNFEKEKK